MCDWNTAKKSFLDMPIDEKREYYRCDENFKTIDDIADWSTYANTDVGKAKIGKGSSKKNVLTKETKSDEVKATSDALFTVSKDSPNKSVSTEETSDEVKTTSDASSMTGEDSAKKNVLDEETKTDKAELAASLETGEDFPKKEILDEETKTDDTKAKLAALSETKEDFPKNDTLDEEMDTDKAELDESSEVFLKNDVLNRKISLFTGDITCLEIDAIVNAANDALMCGGGVDGAIHSAAGRPMLKAECYDLDGCHTGDAKITGGYMLPAKYVIHAVGPRGVDADLLSSCYKKSMDLLKEHELETIAFPCISTGIYGYPNEKAAEVALETIRKWLDEDEYSSKVKRVIFCLFLDVDIKIYHKLLPKYFPL